MSTKYKLKEPWPSVPNRLEVCQDAQQIGTTYERLAKHMVTHHKDESWLVTNRAQTELEEMHDRAHLKTAARPANHTHFRPVRIVGYEVKDEPVPPVLHKFPFKTQEEAEAFVLGLAVFGSIESFLKFPRGMRSPIVHDKERERWVVTIIGDIPGFEGCRSGDNNEYWHEESFKGY